MNIAFTNWKKNINAYKLSLGLYFLLCLVFTSCKDHAKEIKPEIIPSFENISLAIEAYGNDTITLKTNKFTGYVFYINNVPVWPESSEQGSDFIVYKIIVPLKC